MPSTSSGGKQCRRSVVGHFEIGPDSRKVRARFRLWRCLPEHGGVLGWAPWPHLADAARSPTTNPT